MANIVMFAILAVVILGSAVMCVTTKRIMRAATFMLFVLFGVAGLYFLLDYTYLGAAQISVYAGGSSRSARFRAWSRTSSARAPSAPPCSLW